jgi:hypothetical protein
MPTEDHKYDYDLLQPAEECLDIQAIGLDSQKRLGEIAEVSFFGQSFQPRLWRVQALGRAAS